MKPAPMTLSRGTPIAVMSCQPKIARSFESANVDPALTYSELDQNFFTICSEGCMVACMSTSTAEFRWSDLARKSTEVGKALDDDGEVIVTRGSRSYRIAQSDPDIALVLRDMCRLLTAVVQTDTQEHAQVILTSAWPWARALPPKDQIALAEEVGPLAESCEALGTWRPLLDSLAAWRGTARAWAEGYVPTGPFAKSTEREVERP